tara:strand:- start:511 stop:783 length:273 start_codon:yes stop_codon:yes gene_type:complete
MTASHLSRVYLNSIRNLKHHKFVAVLSMYSNTYNVSEVGDAVTNAFNKYYHNKDVYPYIGTYNDKPKLSNSTCLKNLRVNSAIFLLPKIN